MTQPGPDGAPLPSAEDADRFFTEVPPTRSTAAGGPARPALPWSPSRRQVGWTLIAAAALLAVAAFGPPIVRASGGSLPAATPTAAPTDAGTSAADPAASGATDRTASLVRSGVGACLYFAPASVLDPVRVVPCDSPDAAFTVIKRLPMGAGAYPGSDALTERATAGCSVLFTNGNPSITPDPNAYRVTVPTRGEWSQGFTSAYCLVNLRP